MRTSSGREAQVAEHLVQQDKDGEILDQIVDEAADRLPLAVKHPAQQTHGASAEGQQHESGDQHDRGRADAELPLIALPGLVHLRITLTFLVLGGTGCCNQGRINDSTATHDQSSLSFVRLPGKRRQFTFFPQKNTSRGIL